MTLEAMQSHEAVTLHHANTDYRRQGVLQLVRPYLSGDRILDMRCLEGALSVELALQGKQVVALDGFNGAVEMTNELARQYGIDKEIARLWELADLRSYTDGESFDCVVCIDLLNHVDDDHETLREIGEVISTGGRLVVVAPAFMALLGRRDRSLGHLRRYSRSQLTRLLKEHGFVVSYARYWNVLALPAYILLEIVLKRRISDPVRYAGAKRSGYLLGPLLRFWYRHVERWLVLPFGLSLFVVAEKQVAQESQDS